MMMIITGSERVGSTDGTGSGNSSGGSRAAYKTFTSKSLAASHEILMDTS